MHRLCVCVRLSHFKLSHATKAHDLLSCYSKREGGGGEGGRERERHCEGEKEREGGGGREGGREGEREREGEGEGEGGRGRGRGREGEREREGGKRSWSKSGNFSLYNPFVLFM